jgi:hypothetical protein
MCWVAMQTTPAHGKPLEIASILSPVAGDLVADHLDHIADKSGLIASLPRSDPQRKLAEKHARSCAPCRAALEEGSRLLVMLRQEMTPSQSSEKPVRHPGASAIESAMDDWPRRLAWVTVGAAAVAWAFQLMVGGGFEFDFDCATVSLGVLAVAIGSVTLLKGKPRLVIAVAVTTSGLLAYLSGTAAGFEPGIGIRCTFRELWGTAIMWTIVMVASRRAGFVPRRWNAVAMAAGGALAAHAGQHLACKVPHSEAHLLVFHVGGVILAIVLAAVTYGRWPAIPAES